MELNMINLKEFTHDYTTRTMANYSTIFNAYLKEKKLQGEEEIEDVFEVTQLINSLFGILIMPFESVKALKKGQMGANNLRDVNQKMKEANETAFNDLSAVIQELKEAHHFYDSYIKDYEDGIAEIAFIHRLRNSLAHSGNNGLRFFPIGEGDQEVSEIKSIIFCDEEDNGKGDSFVAELAVDQVERVVKSLAEIFGNFTDFADFYDLADYQRTIHYIRNKMESVYEGSFEFDKRDLKIIHKLFKGNLEVDPIDDRRRRGRTLVFNEAEFLNWIFQSRGRYRLVGPEKACEKMNQLAEAALLSCNSYKTIN